MRKLPELDLEEHYGFCSHDSPHIYKPDLNSIVETVKTTKNPVMTVAHLVPTISLFLEGIIDNSFNGDLDKVREAYYNLLTLGRETVGALYRGEEIDFKEVEDTIKKHERVIFHYSNKKMPMHEASKGRPFPLFPNYYGNVNFKKDFQELARFVLNDFKKKNLTIDAIIGIAKSGIEPTLLIADSLEVKPLFIIHPKTNGLLFDKETVAENVKGKTVLLSDDYAAGYDTMHGVNRYLANNMKPRELYFSVNQIQAGRPKPRIVKSDLDLYISN